MPIIPLLNPVQGNLQAQAPSIGAAMAPGKATAAFGEAVQNVSEDLSKIQARDDQAAENELRLVANKADAEHQLFREQNIDESTWEQNRRSLYNQVQEAAAKAKVTPQKRREIDLMVGSWDVESKRQTATIGERQKSSRQRTLTTKLIRSLEDNDKWDEASDARKKAVEKGIYHPEEGKVDQTDADFRRQQFTKEKAFKADLAEIDQDPFSAREKYASPTPPEGTDPTEYHRKREYHRQRIAREQGSIIDAVRDGIASGKITRTDQLDEYQDELGAATIATLKSGMEKATDEGRKKLAAMPAYQARIIGSVSSAIDELDPNDIEARVKIEARLDDILPGPTKTQLSGELSRKLAGEPAQPGPMRRVRTMLNEATRRGYFGPVGSSEPQLVKDVKDDGFLKDPANMSKLFNEKDAAAITDPKLSKEERLAKFRETWPKRNTAADNPEDYTIRAGQAIYQMAPNVPKTKAEKGAEFRDAWQALQRKGEIEQALIEWQQDHPEGDVEAELMRRMGDAESQAFLDSMDGGNWFGDEFMADPTGDPTEPDLPSTFGGSDDSLLPGK